MDVSPIPSSQQSTVQPSACSVHPIQSNAYASQLALFAIFSNYASSAREIKYPIVLIHGFTDIPGLSGTWASVEEALRKEAGIPKSEILTVQMPPLKTIEERTNSAIRDITAKFPGKTVHLIAHSMVRSPPVLVITILNRLSVGWFKCSRHCRQIWN